jgi:hypothetical protein
VGKGILTEGKVKLSIKEAS